ncbi:Aminoglycoside N(3)-acetyltransferase [Purpureocillium takamizusanense]|uniref:Aminoglycoside N(3)-acetyltransferase n=1 Tax=Purpureocillium takamizusanense TaxID=2060973 RepID=A0A9Q8VC91_9HYPO|nr:Aminoglycoside N(3)-acetyltransferase [Purpureocillium takamizusanense]UNI20478.1 Aminoglycoside N(3)-acetyltransferase [Purpureocillium takamizusanense]
MKNLEPRCKTPKGPLCTQASLVEDLGRLGLQAGDTVLLHSSLSAMGFVVGGAPAVVRALLEVLGPGGTLAAPTHTGDNSDPAEWCDPPVPRDWWQPIRDATPAFDPRTAPSRMMGVVAETLRNWPGARRSAHPQTSFAAVGARADDIVTEGPAALECRLGQESPLAALERLGARVLLLGCGFDRCTSFHLAEYRNPYTPVENSFAALVEDGPGGQTRREWVTVHDVPIDSDDFAELGQHFEESGGGGGGGVASGMVGAAECKLFSMPEAVAFAVEWLSTHRNRG